MGGQFYSQEQIHIMDRLGRLGGRLYRLLVRRPELLGNHVACAQELGCQTPSARRAYSQVLSAGGIRLSVVGAGGADSSAPDHTGSHDPVVDRTGSCDPLSDHGGSRDPVVDHTGSHRIILDHLGVEAAQPGITDPDGYEREHTGSHRITPDHPAPPPISGVARERAQSQSQRPWSQSHGSGSGSMAQIADPVLVETMSSDEQESAATAPESQGPGAPGPEASGPEPGKGGRGAWASPKRSPDIVGLTEQHAHLVTMWSEMVKFGILEGTPPSLAGTRNLLRQFGLEEVKEGLLLSPLPTLAYRADRSKDADVPRRPAPRAYLYRAVLGDILRGEKEVWQPAPSMAEILRVYDDREPAEAVWAARQTPPSPPPQAATQAPTPPPDPQQQEAARRTSLLGRLLQSCMALGDGGAVMEHAAEAPTPWVEQAIEEIETGKLGSELSDLIEQGRQRVRQQRHQNTQRLSAWGSKVAAAASQVG